MKVVRVTDGNTLVLEGGQEVHLIGVNAPSPYEAYESLSEEEQIRKHEMGRKAKDFLKFLVEGKPVRLELEPMHAKAFKHKDLQGRILSYVWFTTPVFQRPPDWLVMDPSIETGRFDAFLNASIIRAGYAQTEMGWPFNYAQKFLALQDEAQNAKRGIWGDEDAEGQEAQPQTEAGMTDKPTIQAERTKEE